MRRHLLRQLPTTTISQILSDPRRPERVIADEEANVNDMPGLSSALAGCIRRFTSARYHRPPARGPFGTVRFSLPKAPQIGKIVCNKE